MYGCVAPDKETLRRNVRDAFERFMTRGEAELAERLYHSDYFNHEADLEHWAVRDDLGLAMQAGLLPAPPGTADGDGA